MHRKNKEEWIEAWRVIDGYELSPEDLALIWKSKTIECVISPHWESGNTSLAMKPRPIPYTRFSYGEKAPYVMKLGHIDTPYCPDLPRQECEKLFSRIVKGAAFLDPFESFRFFLEALVRIIYFWEKEIKKFELIHLINSLFNATSYEYSRNTSYIKGIDRLIYDLHSIKTIYPPKGEKIPEYFTLFSVLDLGGKAYCLADWSFKFLKDMFIESLLMNKPQTIHLLDGWGYPLREEQKGLTKDLIAREREKRAQEEKPQRIPVNIPPSLWAGLKPSVIFENLQENYAHEVIAYILVKKGGLDKTNAGRLFYQEEINNDIVHEPTTYRRKIKSLLDDCKKHYVLSFIE